MNARLLANQLIAMAAAAFSAPIGRKPRVHRVIDLNRVMPKIEWRRTWPGALSASQRRARKA